jgi:acetyltransferase-like isoleucine patch superfamily enzyme
MGWGLRKRLCKSRVRLNVLRAKFLNFLFGFEEVAMFIRKLDKASIQAILREFGAHVGRNCDIESGLVIHRASKDFRNLSVADNCHLGKDVFLDLTAPIQIYDSCTISMRCVLLTHFDPGCAQIGQPNCKPHAAGVEIGPHTYLGAGVIVLPGVRIGRGSVVGAGAVVTEDVPSGSLAVGVPARIIRRIDMGEESG